MTILTTVADIINKRYDRILSRDRDRFMERCDGERKCAS